MQQHKYVFTNLVLGALFFCFSKSAKADDLTCHIAPSETVVPQSVSFEPSSPWSLIRVGKLAVDQTTTDDLSMVPKRQYLAGIPQPGIVSFLWGQPMFKSQPRDSWGQPIITDPSEPLMVMADAWSPVLGLHVTNFLGEPIVKDLFAPPRILELGYLGSVTTTEVKGDPTGLSCDPVTFEVRANNSSALPKYNFSTKSARVVKDGWDLTWKWFPYSAFFLPSGATQFGYAEGTYKGKPVELVGAFDRYNLLPVAYSALLAKRMLNLFVARGVDGKFEYGLVLAIKDLPANNGGWAFGGVYCKDGEGCVVSNKLKLKNVKWEASPTSPQKFLPVEGTYEFGGKEIYIKAKAGFELTNMKNSGVRGALVSLVTSATNWSDATAIWQEKNSPSFDLSFSLVETYGFTARDVEELQALGSR